MGVRLGTFDLVRRKILLDNASLASLKQNHITPLFAFYRREIVLGRSVNAIGAIDLKLRGRGTAIVVPGCS